MTRLGKEKTNRMRRRRRIQRLREGGRQ